MPVTLKSVLLRDRMLMSRLGLAAGSALWAIQLAMPVEVFPTAQMLAEGTGRKTYALMATIAPEMVWALFFAIHAIFATYTLFTGVRNTVTLAADGFLGCIIWSGATIACYASHWPKDLPFFEAFSVWPAPVAMSADIVMAFYAWWHMIRFWAEEETHNKGCPLPACEDSILGPCDDTDLGTHHTED